MLHQEYGNYIKYSFLMKALEKCMLYTVLNIFLESCTYMEMSKNPVLGREIWLNGKECWLSLIGLGLDFQYLLIWNCQTCL